MSQQKQLSSYFKTCKRNNLPGQHATKRRKVILQGHQIEQLLNSDEEDHAEPSDMTSPTPVEGLSEPPPGADGNDEFVDDDDWENLANTTLDGM